MSDKEILRRKALTAAASVVLAMGMGCRSWIEPDAPVSDPYDDSSTTDTSDTAGGLDTAASEDTADTGSLDTADTDPGDGRPDCTEPAFPHEDNATCCAALYEWCQEAFPDDHEAASECTFGPEYDGSTGCSPWGPPVPPRFREAVA